MTSGTFIVTNSIFFVVVRMIQLDSTVSLQLAKAGSHAFTEKSFRRRRVCDVCKQNIDNPGAFCKGESTSQSGQAVDPETQRTSMNTHLDLTAMSSP